MSRDWWRDYWLLVVAVAVVAVVLVLALVDDGRKKRECEASGGRVEKVHGGKGGWVCARPR